MTAERSFRFTHTISRSPSISVSAGIRAVDGGDPDPVRFATEHENYLNALAGAGVNTILLPALEQYPDSVFVEDPALCFGGVAVMLRPGAQSRAGEAEAIRPALEEVFGEVIVLETDGHVDGGDILLTDTEALVGLSDRTDNVGLNALVPHLQAHGYKVRIVHTPQGVLHFKSDCSLLDSSTILSTRALAASGCFAGYTVIETPPGEEAVANLIRVNDVIIMRTGFPKTSTLLENNGYQVVTVDAEEAAKIDGGLSCMSLRFSI